MSLVALKEVPDGASFVFKGITYTKKTEIQAKGRDINKPKVWVCEDTSNKEIPFDGNVEVELKDI